MQHQALDWLYKQLKQKRVALAKAESKPNTPQSEIINIKMAICTIEWIIATVLKADWDEENG